MNRAEILKFADATPPVIAAPWQVASSRIVGLDDIQVEDIRQNLQPDIPFRPAANDDQILEIPLLLQEMRQKSLSELFFG